jgi:hypothetical protein
VRRRAALGLALAAAALACGAAACGTPPADLFVVQRSGSIPGARLNLRVADDGSASCDGRPLKEITSAQLITARQATRDLQKPSEAHLRLPAQPGSIMRYRVRSEDGTVAWSDTSRGQPPVLFTVAKLTRDIARGTCGLAR